MWLVVYFMELFVTIAIVIFSFAVNNIMVFNSFIFGAITYALSSNYIHSGLAFLIAIIVFFVTIGIQNTKIGFLIIGSVMSIVYGGIGGGWVYSITDGDWIWTIVIWVLVTIIFFGLHLNDKSKYSADDE